MNFFSDENFPKYAVQILRSQNHVVLDIRGTDKEGMSDNDIFELSLASNAVFLTTDKDFFHTVHFGYPTHPGIVVIALSKPNARNIIRRLEWFLNAFGNNRDDYSNRCFLVTDQTCRIY